MAEEILVKETLVDETLVEKMSVDETSEKIMDEGCIKARNC